MAGGSNRPAYRSPQRWTSIERELRAEKGPLLAGVDEVGRGPLAGPVVACAVIMPHDAHAIRGVDDSKLLTLKERVRLVSRIKERALAFAIGAASVKEIDRLNIYHASTLAMMRALRRLKVTPDHVIVDGRAIRALPFTHTAVVHGDARCHSIACASIIAKVTRDRVMASLAARHPHYGWEHNAGYATRDHMAGLNGHGATRHHRQSFVPVRQTSFDFSTPPAVEGLADVLHDEQAIIAEALGESAASASDRIDTSDGCSELLA